MTEKRQSRGSRFLRTSAWLALSVLLLGGCGSTRPSKFYVLHSLSMGGAEKPLGPAGVTGVEYTIGVGPVKIPEYLDRQEIVTRAGANRLDLAEFDRWAEPLESNVARVLAENLSFILGTDRVRLFPWVGSTKVDYQVVVDLNRFDGTSEGKAILAAHWSILEGEKRKVLVTRKSHFAESADRADFESMVSAQSRLLGHLSREIASEITALAHAPSGQGEKP